MDQVPAEEINLIYESDDDIAIFDRDNWKESEVMSISEKVIEDDEGHRANNEMIKEISKELENSKEHFFQVQVHPTTKKTGGKKLKSLKNIRSRIEQNSRKILKEGYSEKKTDGIFFKWHMRFLALTSEKLFLFETHHKGKVIGCVNFKLLPTSVSQHEQTIILDFENQCENIILKIEDSFQREEWVMWLEEVVKYHKNNNKLMIQTMAKPIYNQKQVITEKELNQFSETGDILIFATKNTGAQIQRFITNSEYDHAAMILKFKDKQMMVFESNLNYGVSVYSWTQYIKYFNLYEKVAFRKLNYMRKTDLHLMLLNFVKKSLGKKYELSAGKLLTFQTDFDWENAKEERGYFCSELVAKALKSAGLLDQKKSSGRYWPVDFSAKSCLEMNKGAWLGPEQVVVLKKHCKNKALI